MENLDIKKLGCRAKDKNPQEEWWINKNKPKKKSTTVSAQQSEASGSENSDNENADETSTTMVSHSGEHAFG